MSYNKDIFKDQRFEEAYQQIKSKLLLDKFPSNNPVAIVLGGLPGAGKGNIYKFYNNKLNGNIVELDCDKFRKYHPDAALFSSEEYGEKTNPFIFAVVDRMIDEITPLKYNYISESSMKSPDVAFFTTKEIKPLGYKVEIAVMATNNDVAWQGTIDRYQQALKKYEQDILAGKQDLDPPRMVDESFFNRVKDSIEKSFEMIYKAKNSEGQPQTPVDEIYIFNRSNEILYRMSDTPNLNPLPIFSARLHLSEDEANKKINQYKHSVSINSLTNSCKQMLNHMSDDNELYTSFLKFQGSIYKHSVYVALEFFNQKPDVDFIGSEEQWKNANYKVRANSKGIKFVTGDGTSIEYFDFSQIDSDVKPSVWILNAQNASHLKNKLNIPENQPLINGLINKYISSEDIKECLTLLKANRSETNKLAYGYLRNVQVILAGRLEMGGNNFNLTADNTVFNGMSVEQKIYYLAHSLKTARRALNEVEKTIINFNETEREKYYELREMDQSDRRRTERSSERGITGNSSGAIGKWNNLIQSNSSAGSADVADNTADRRENNNMDTAGISTGDSQWRNDVVQAQADNRDVHIESRAGRAVTERGTDRDLWNEVDGLHEAGIRSSVQRNDDRTQIPDGSTQSRLGSDGLQRTPGTGVRKSESETNELRGNSDLGTEQSNVRRQHSDERDSAGSKTINDFSFSDKDNKEASADLADASLLSNENAIIHPTASVVNSSGSTEAFYDEDDHADDDLPEISYADNPGERLSANIAAINTLKNLEQAEKLRGDTYVSEYETNTLRKYVGWGGLADIFDENKSVYNLRRNNLKNLLTEEEYKAARSSTLNAHYTSQIVIDAMYKAIESMDLPRNARILEPACGTGNFIARLPVKFNDAEVVGVELDSITSRIADWLNKNDDKITIINSPFEKTTFADNSFDLAIGNVPFGNYNLIDPDHKDNWKIHDAFFRKALDKVAPGGVIAFITSTGTLDKNNPKVREYLSQYSDLIGAIRLPNNVFASAGTKVSTDIIFLQKRESARIKGDYPDWCYTVSNSDGLKINSYFVQNPNMILGKVEQTTHFNMLTCSPLPNADLKSQLEKAITHLKAHIIVKKRENAINQIRNVIEPWGKNFSYQITEKGVFFRENNLMRQVDLNEKNTLKLQTLISIRSAARELVDLQKTDITDDALVSYRNKLNDIYDIYYKNYGAINEGRAAAKLFSMDYDYPLVAALEYYDKETDSYNKTEIFSKRTVKYISEITEAADIEEAYQVSMDQHGKIDIPYMAQLLKNVYTSNAENQIADELVEKGYAFRDPDEIVAGIPFSEMREKSEYLSGNVRRKLHSAEEAAKTNPYYSVNVDALKQVLPEDIHAEEISVRMGCSWIDTDDYSRFLKQLSGKCYMDHEVSYDPLSGEYSIAGSKSRSGFNTNESSVYGTAEMNMYKIAEKILNQRRIVVQESVPNPYGTNKTMLITNSSATALALEKAKLIKSEFAKWIFSDRQRREKYERKYNDIFNSIVGRTYDGSHLTFPGMNSEFTLRPHQKSCIARTIYGGNTLAAHVVGAGKSAVLITSVMKKKQINLINKACVVVPKPLIEQTANEWRKIYPDARVLTVSNKDLSDENKRKLFTARVVTGSYDAVIMSNEQFEKLAMSNTYKAKYIEQRIDEYEDILRSMKSGRSGRSKTVKQIEEALIKAKEELEDAVNPTSSVKSKDDFIEFESLGFDYLVVDEAHIYKNGAIISKMENVSGVGGKTSKRAEDMRMKTEYFNQKFGQGHILFATGTPVSNSMTELYVMQQYLRPDILKAQGVDRFDDWAATFGNVVTKNQQTADGRLKLKTKFASFVNLPELMAMYKEFADIQSADKLNLPRPALKSGKIQIVKVPATPEQKKYVKYLASRAQAIEKGMVKPNEDNHLAITGEARLVGLGNLAIKALYEKKGSLPVDFALDKNSKVDKCIDNVARIYQETDDKKCVQIIFSDIAINNDKGNFSVYNYIKDELKNKGIPEEEIIFAPKSDAKNREQIFSDINESKYRIVIASTGTLGTGANIQKNLYALHHVDIPWKPSDFTQREGRILRQGNTNKEVEIYNYVTEGTLDSYLYQTVTDKARFIAQLLDNNAPSRVSEDCDEKVLTFAEIQAAAEGNPDFKKRIELSNEIAELTMLQSEYNRETAHVRNSIQSNSKLIIRLKEDIVKCSSDIESAKKLKESDLILKTHDGITLADHKDINDYLINIAGSVSNSNKISDKFSIGDFIINAEYSANFNVVFVVQRDIQYECTAGTNDNSDNLFRINRLFDKGMNAKKEELERRLEFTETELIQAEDRIKKPFSEEEKLKKLTEEFNEIETRLSKLSAASDDIIGADDAVVNNSPGNVTENKNDDEDSMII